jgi:NAD(P)-dependent dehydrogenase (short-subunit alcohol dehydrogenase family)
MSTSRWTSADLPSQQGRTFVITGANSGIGLAAAKALGEAGAHVVLAVRDTSKGEQAAKTVPGSTEVRRLDLADLSSVREFASATDGDIDVLVNNAGVMATPPKKTKDGFELQFGTNHLGHFALTNLLLPRIKDRVVTVSSLAHRRGEIKLDDLNWERREYKAWAAYSQSKLANLLFTLELTRRLADAGSEVTAYAAHPGWAATNLQQHTGSRLQNAIMQVGNRLIAQSDSMGALPTLYVATQDLPAGSYAGPGGWPRESRGNPTLVGRTKAASDAEMAKRLWDASEQLTEVTFPLGEKAATPASPAA